MSPPPAPDGFLRAFSGFRRVASSPFTRGVAIVLSLLVLVPGILFVAPQLAASDHSFVVLSSSMEPTFGPGDLIFVRSADAASIAIGDVITFYPDAQSDVLVTHRVHDVVISADGLTFRTKGDANEERDPFFVPANDVVGVYAFHLPAWGLILQALRSQAGYLALVLVPASLVLAREFVSLYRTLDEAERKGGGSLRRGLRAVRAGRSAGLPRPVKLIATLLIATLLTHAVTSLPADGSGAAHALGGGGLTLAYVSDTELGKGNVFTAGDFVTGCPLTAPPPYRAPGGAHSPDPGFAFKDANCNGVFDAIGDVIIPNNVIRSGTYHAGAGCLVIPPSVGPITAGSIDFSATGGIILAVNLTATSGNIKLTSSTSVRAEGVRINATQNMEFIGGTIRMNRSEIGTSSMGSVKLQSGGTNAIYVTNASLFPSGNLHLLSDGQLIASDTAMKSINGNIQLKAGSLLRAPRSVIRTPNGNVQMDATSGTIDIDGSLLLSASGNFQPKASSGGMSARNACIRSVANAQLTAEGNQGTLELAGATIISDTSLVELLAQGNRINVTAGNLSAISSVKLDVPGNVHAQNARMSARNGGIEVDVKSGANTFFVQGARFYDPDNAAQLKPGNAKVVGVPAHGTVKR